MFFFKKKKKKPRPLLSGFVDIGGLSWNVREEKRGGEQTQILILDRDGGRMEMHVRPPPGKQASSIEEIATLAADPTYRYVFDKNDRCWEARIVVTSEPDVPPQQLIKFISKMDVFERDYPFDSGMGLRSDQELLDLLENA